MRRFRWLKQPGKPLAALLAALALAVSGACGGGGGGGGQTPQVSVYLSAPLQVQATVLQNGVMPSQALFATASGDLASLAGRTLYVAVEDPDGLFDPDAAPVISPTGVPGQYSLLLPGHALASAGHFTGNLKVYVATDRALQHQLTGSPMSMPYDVTVRPGLTLGSQRYQLTTRFGDPYVEQVIQADLPDDVTSWSADDVTVYDYSTWHWWAPHVTHDADGTVTVRVYPMPAGSYTFTIRITAYAALPGAQAQAYTRDVTLACTVQPNDAVDFAVDPGAELQVSVPYGLTSPVPSAYMIIPNTGVTNTGQGGIEYLAHPAAADGLALATAWWSSHDQAISIYWVNGQTPEQLPPGTYTARMRHTLSKGGADFDVYVPITLTVTP